MKGSTKTENKNKKNKPDDAEMFTSEMHGPCTRITAA